MIAPDDFWQFLSHCSGLRAAAGAWRACLGNDLWDQLRGRLFVGHGLAYSYRRPGDSRSLRVVALTRGRYALVCEVVSELVAKGIPEADVQCYGLDLTVFRHLVAEALAIPCEPGQVWNTPRAFPLGTWSPLDAVEVPAFLMLPPTSQLLVGEVRRLLVEAVGGFLLLLPEQPQLETSLCGQLKRKKAMVVALRDILAWDGDHLCATPAWDTYRNAYCTRHLLERMVPAPPPYEFRKQGDFWTVRFRGACVHLKDAVGQAYIAQLLASPHREFFAPHLFQTVTGELAVGQVGSAGEQADRQTFEAVKGRYYELLANREQAQRDNDLPAQQRLQHEIEGLDEYLKKTQGFGGRMRRASDDADKIRRAMTQAIGRTIESLRDKLPSAAHHLQNTIKTGLFLAYEPEEELPWNL